MLYRINHTLLLSHVKGKMHGTLKEIVFSRLLQYGRFSFKEKLLNGKERNLGVFLFVLFCVFFGI